MCVAPHIASLTTPVNVFCSADGLARIATGASTVAASIGITFTENIVFIVLSPLDDLKQLQKLLALRVRFFWLQSPATQCALLHQCEEHWHENQDVDRGRNHASDDGRRNGLHHV